MRIELSHMFDNVVLAMEDSDLQSAEKALVHEGVINRMQVEYRTKHIERMSSGECDPMTGLLFVEFINNMEKIGDHLANVAQGVIGGLQWRVSSADQTTDDDQDSPVEASESATEETS